MSGFFLFGCQTGIWSASVSSYHSGLFCRWLCVVLCFAISRYSYWSLGRSRKKTFWSYAVTRNNSYNFTCCLAACNSCRVVCRSIENFLCFRRFHSDINTSIQNMNVGSCGKVEELGFFGHQSKDLNATKIPSSFHSSRVHGVAAKNYSSA